MESISNCTTGLKQVVGRIVQLPSELLLAIVSHATLQSALSLTLTCKAFHGLQRSRSFWLLLTSDVAQKRPIPLLDIDGATLNQLQEAIMTSTRLHKKWTKNLNGEPSRHYLIPSRTLSQTHRQTAAEDSLSWTLLLQDGKHFVQYDIDGYIKLRTVDKGSILWSIPMLGEVGCLDCGYYQGDIILILNIGEGMYAATSRMEIWRYRGPYSHDLVYKSQLPNPMSTPYYTRGNFLMGNYGGCVVMLTPDKVAIYIVDWLNSKEACFEAQTPAGDVSTILLDNELVMAHEWSERALIQGWSMQDLTLHMSPASSSTQWPQMKPMPPPSQTLTIDYDSENIALSSSLMWWPVLQPLRDGKRLRLLSRAVSSSGPSDPLLGMVSFDWEKVRDSERVRSITLRRSFLRHTYIVRSRYGVDLCTQGNCRKTSAWLSDDDEGRMVFRFAEVDGETGDPSEPPSADGVPRIGREFGFAYPKWLQENGEVLSMDLDDSRGRMALTLASGSVAIFEFV